MFRANSEEEFGSSFFQVWLCGAALGAALGAYEVCVQCHKKVSGLKQILFSQVPALALEAHPFAGPLTAEALGVRAPGVSNDVNEMLFCEMDAWLQFSGQAQSQGERAAQTGQGPHTKESTHTVQTCTHPRTRRWSLSDRPVGEAVRIKQPRTSAAGQAVRTPGSLLSLSSLSF